MEVPVLNPEGVEYYYSMPEKTVLLLGNSALALAEHGSYLEWLSSQNRLLTDEAAAAVMLGDNAGEAPNVLGDLLRSQEPNLERVGKRTQFMHWSLDDSLAYGRWLYGLLPAPEPPCQTRINQHVLSRANLLGLGPGFHFLTSKNNFRYIANFYRQIGADEAWLRHDEVTSDDALNYVLDLSRQLGRMPTGDELDELAIQDTSKMSYQVILSRLPEGGLTTLAREAGFFRPERSGGQAQLEWGVDFKLANNQSPSQRYMKLAAQLGHAPNAFRTTQIFGGEPAFRYKVDEAYSEGLETVKDEFRRQETPVALLKTVDSEADMVARAVRFKIARQLLPEAGEEYLVSLSSLPWGEEEFIDHLTSRNPSLTRFDVFQASKLCGVFKNAWRTEYINSLAMDQVISQLLDRDRGKLDSRSRRAFNDGIAEAIELLDRLNISILNPNRIQELRVTKKLAEGAYFQKLYGNEAYFRILVAARISRHKAKIINGQRERLLSK